MIADTPTQDAILQITHTMLMESTDHIVSRMHLLILLEVIQFLVTELHQAPFLLEGHMIIVCLKHPITLTCRINLPVVKSHATLPVRLPDLAEC